MTKKLILYFIIIFVIIGSIFLIEKKHLKQIYYQTLKQYYSNDILNCFNKTKNFSPKKTVILAGHTYGHPSDNNLGTYPKFIKEIKKRNYKQSDIIVLLGDLVRNSNLFNLNKVNNEFRETFNKIYALPGNHDVELGASENLKRNLFISIFDELPKYFRINNTLFVLLDTTYLPGSITKKQLIFFDELIKREKNLDNLFILTHHAIWSHHVERKVISGAGKKFFEKNNFLELKKITEGMNKETQVYFISGDAGISNNMTQYFCENKNNFYYLLIGMGNRNLDNYLKIDISTKDDLIKISPIFF